MEDLHLWQPALRQPPDLPPGRPVFLASAPERAPPEPYDIATDSDQRRAVGGQRVVGEVAERDAFTAYLAPWNEANWVV